VRDEVTNELLGFLTETFARKRYVEEINRATEEVFQ
jgi:CIC family chloride channel protein